MKAVNKVKLIGNMASGLFPNSTNIMAVQIGDQTHVTGEGELDEFLECIVGQMRFLKEETGLSDLMLWKFLMDLYFGEEDEDYGGYDEAFDDPDEA